MSQRPISVLRNNSMSSHTRPQSRVGFSLPRQAQPVRISQVECGSGIIPKRCLNCCCPAERCNHAKLASPKIFVSIFIVVLILHGATEGYLAEILPTIVLRFRLPAKVSEWVLIGHKLSQVLVGIFIAHTAGENRPRRLGGFLALFALSCGILIAPHLVHGDVHIQATAVQKGPQLCHLPITEFGIHAANYDEICWVMLGLLFLFQFLAGVTCIALMSHGITYIDDNLGKINSPAYIGAAFGVGYIGRKLGSLLGWICLEIPLSKDTSKSTSILGAWWLGWPYLCASLLIGALFISLFPNLMPATAVKRAARKILCHLREETVDPNDEGASKEGREESENLLPDISLLGTLKRLLKNQMIIASLLASIFLEAALGNFLAIEPIYLESVYQIPRQGILQMHGMQTDGFEDPWMSRLITGMLKTPLIAMTLIVSGLLISRIKPKATSVAAWAASMALLSGIIAALFLTMICPSKMVGENDGRLEVEQLCNIDCQCSGTGTNPMFYAFGKISHAEFMPVCSMDRKTYFSPCHAGCKSSRNRHGIQVFGNCSCIGNVGSENEVKLGACIGGDSIQCRFGWIFFQGSLALIQILIASGVVGKLLLCLRCVLPQDKPMVFGLEMACVSFFAYVPFKLLYNYLKDLSCMSWTDTSGMCEMQESYKLSLSINILTSSLFIISGIFTIWVAVLAKRLELYGTDDDEDSYNDSGYDEIDEDSEVTLRERRYGTPWPVRKKRGKRSNGDDDLLQQSGLLQMIVSHAPPRQEEAVSEASALKKEEEKQSTEI